MYMCKDLYIYMYLNINICIYIYYIYIYVYVSINIYIYIYVCICIYIYIFAYIYIYNVGVCSDVALPSCVASTGDLLATSLNVHHVCQKLVPVNCKISTS